MSRFSRRSHRVGLEPGTLKVTQPPEHIPTRITVMDYGPDTFEARAVDCVEDALAPRASGTVRWINVDGVHDAQVINALGRQFQLHPLLLEDVVTVAQRSKVESYGEITYLVVRMLHLDEEGDQVESEQLSIVLADDVLISFQERTGDVFDAVRQRIRSGRPRMRSGGTLYLAYALLDAVVDHYFVLLERIGDQIEALEDALLERPTAQVLARIHHLKRELVYLRKSVWPLREAISVLLRDDPSRLEGDLHLYLRDLYDHTVHVIESIESYRDLVASMLETYHSSVSNRMNEIMKTLTVIATVFIPLTFITGIYGMNFEYMPELHLRWAYPTLWAIMVVAISAMLLQFRRRGWV